MSTILPIDSTQTGTTIPRYIEPESLGNERVRLIPQNFSTEASTLCHILNIRCGGLKPLKWCSWRLLQPNLTELLMLVLKFKIRNDNNTNT